MDPFVNSCVEELKKRSLTDGGFASSVKGGYRPDSTAWAVIALSAAGIDDQMIHLARSRLVSDQQKDGRIPVSPSHPEAFWPTSVVILAWQGSPVHREPQSLAVKFLLDTTGAHWPKDPDAAMAHDTSIKGWSWIENTHSWVDPTALSLQALKVTGYEKHQRSAEAVRMLLDRQLPRGGWNCGNTMVFGKTLRPMPDSTGIALDALFGMVPLEKIRDSIGYLKNRIKKVRSPLSLGWGILGLGAWGEKPAEAPKWLMECRRLQKRYGSYDTSLISLILLARLAPSSLMSTVGRKDI
jgi:hypothetical protein